jgi:hypothetical protein
MAKPDATIVHTIFARVIISFSLGKWMFGGLYPSAPTPRDNAAINRSGKYS